MREDLPVPDLTEVIRAEIAARGVISFERFMTLALYCPDLGYYETGKDRVGFQGDFYTSVSTGELFGQFLAFRFAGWLAELPADAGPLRIVEAGAHDGRLAKDILRWLRQHRTELYGRVEYCVVEPSARRREWQGETLQEFAGKVRWAENLKSIEMSTSSPLPSPPFHGGEGVQLDVNRTAAAMAAGGLNGIIFSNELLDAMPVHRLGWDAAWQEWFEWGVGWDGERFAWARLPPPVCLEAAVRLPLELLRVLPDNYTIETSPAAVRWWHEAAAALGHGRLLTLDYGFTSQELIQPGRTKGTLRAYYRHSISDQLLANPGEQDLTAHVNFSAIQIAGENAGLKTEGYLTQPQFLTKILAEAVKDEAFKDWNQSRTRQFQTLTHPEHMGRAFKVLVQGR